MGAKVTLEVVEGTVEGSQTRFEFDRRDIFIFGRHPDCHARLPEGNSTASRHHFVLDVSPPNLSIRDLGSYNGTWVNGVKYGGRKKGEGPELSGGRTFPDVPLHDGDTIRVGQTHFKVHVQDDRPAVAETAWEDGAPAESEVPAALAGTDPGEVLRALAQKETRKAGDDVVGFHVQRELGRGGMGAVYLAERERDGRQVALKIMLAHVAVQQTARQLFARECHNAEQLRHPSIVELIEHDSVGGAFWCALEFCAAGSVRDRMTKLGGRLPLEEAGPLMLDVLRGLEYAHHAEVDVVLADGTQTRAVGVVHRDLKPENLLVVEGPRGLAAKITDFGLAKAFDTAGLSGVTGGGAGGTPPYMPREQVTNFVRVRPVSDVWAAAATFYSMITGAYVRDFVAGKDVLLQVLQHPVVPLRQRDASLPVGVDRVLAQALEEDPNNRIPTARAFHDELAAVL